MTRIRRLRCCSERLILMACAAVSLSGCVAASNYQPSAPALPDRFHEPAMSASSRASGQPGSEDRWWEDFGDPTLNALIERARQGAPTIFEANARLREARALRGVAMGAHFPTVNAAGGYARRHGSASVPTGTAPGGLGPGIDSNLWQAGFDASWELDVFGGERRTVEAATATAQAAVAERADVELSLVAEIARNYMELRGAQRQIVVAHENLIAQQSTVDLIKALFESGLAARLELLRAEAQVADTNARIPSLEASVKVPTYRIAALMDDTPDVVTGELQAPGHLTAPTLQPVPIGLPSDLLRRRPDIRVAERRIAAAHAKVGVAQADLYPHFSLTGIAGLESLDFSSFFNGYSRYFSVGPHVYWLVFDANRVRFRISAEQAREDAATAAYTRTVLDALRDVESALATYGSARERGQRLSVEIASEKEAVVTATALYSQGLSDYLTVLDAQRALFIAEDALVQSDRDCATAVVSLYKSLGGGWEHSRSLETP